MLEKRYNGTYFVFAETPGPSERFQTAPKMKGRFMSVAQVRDYLQTQGLKLPEDDVRVGLLAAQAVMAGGQAEIDGSVLWRTGQDSGTAVYFERTPAQEALLKQIFMALDSVFTRAGEAQSAAVYALMPSENAPVLLCLAQQGQPLPPLFQVDDEGSRFHLPVRTAQTGWLNLAEDVERWLDAAALEGSHNLRSQSQMSLPVYAESGRMLGVVHIEYAGKAALDEAAQAGWTALALALTVPLQALLEPENQEEKND